MTATLIDTSVPSSTYSGHMCRVYTSRDVTLPYEVCPLSSSLDKFASSYIGYRTTGRCCARLPGQPPSQVLRPCWLANAENGKKKARLILT